MFYITNIFKRILTIKYNFSYYKLIYFIYNEDRVLNAIYKNMLLYLLYN